MNSVTTGAVGAAVSGAIGGGGASLVKRLADGPVKSKNLIYVLLEFN